MFVKIILHVLQNWIFQYIVIIKSTRNLYQNSKWNWNNFVLQNMLTETLGSSWYHYETHFDLSNCGSLENWFSINYMFVITCLYLYIFIFRYTHVDLWLHFCRFSFFSLLPPKINFNTRRRAFVTLHAKSISWPEDYFNLIIWFNFLFKVQEEFNYPQQAERLMIAQ